MTNEFINIICTHCKQSFLVDSSKEKEYIWHTVKDVYDNPIEKWYRCKDCNTVIQKKVEEDKFRKEEEIKKAEEKYLQEKQNRFNTISKTFVNSKIIDIHHSGNDEYDIFLDNGHILHIWHSEYGGIDLE